MPNHDGSARASSGMYVATAPDASRRWRSWTRRSNESTGESDGGTCGSVAIGAGRGSAGTGTTPTAGARAAGSHACTTGVPPPTPPGLGARPTVPVDARERGRARQVAAGCRYDPAQMTTDLPPAPASAPGAAPRPVGPPTPDPVGWSPAALRTLALVAETIAAGDGERRAR